jgi:integrase
MNKIHFGKSGNKSCPFEVRWNENGKTKRKRFKIKIDALQFLETMKSEEILPTELQLSIADRMAFSRIKNLCAKKQIDIEKVIQLITDYHNPLNVVGCDWSEAVAQYLADCKKRKVRNTTQNDYTKKLSLFQRTENVLNVAEITLERATSFLANISSPQHYKTALRPFFNFCCEKGWIVENPFVEAKIEKTLSDNKLPIVLPIEAVKNLFAKLKKEYLPEFALMTFAGVRPMELAFNSEEPKDILKIGDIDFKNKTIRIRPSVAKTRTERLLVGLPNNLWEFLKPLQNRRQEEDVAILNFDRNYRMRLKLGAGGKDILRHSFGSYGYHYLGAEHSVEILGHITDFKTFVKNYKGLASKEDSVEYFSIVPNYQSRQ